MIDRRHLQQAFLLLLAAGALFLCYLLVEPFIAPLITASAMAVLFYPLHVRLERRLRGRRGLAATISLLLVFALIVIPAVFLLTTMSREATAAYTALKTKSAAGGGWLEWISDAAAKPLVSLGMPPENAALQIEQFLNDRLESIGGATLRLAQRILSNVAGFLMDSILTLFILFFLFRDGRAIISKTREFLPLDNLVFDRLLAEVGQSVLANLYGVGAVALAQGTLTGILFWGLELRSPVLFGVVAAFASMIPFIGPPIVWVPAAISLAVAGSWGKALILTVAGIGLIGTADNILRPWIISGRVQLHPLLVFISLLGGAQAFGFLGLLIGPAALSVTIVVLEVLRHGLPGRVQPVLAEDLSPEGPGEGVK